MIVLPLQAPFPFYLLTKKLSAVDKSKTSPTIVTPPLFFSLLRLYWIITEHFHSAYLCLVGFFLGPCLVVMKI